jgi:fimbrial chaperone protein
MQKNTIKQMAIGILISVLAHQTSANLLINPTRVVFNPTDRSTDVTLINISKTTNTYRIEWSEKKAKSDGGYDELTATTVGNFPIASSMLRYSPKQVTLKAGERQTIKMAVRRPQELADGEYRSHLVFKALPPMGPTLPDQPVPESAGSSMKVNILLTFAIPVVVKHGQVTYHAALDEASITYNAAAKTGTVTLNMSRSGTNSVIGNLDAYWTPVGGSEQLIAKSGDFNFWPEINKVKASLNWVGTSFAPTDGKLRIAYEGTKDFRGNVFFDKTINITRSMIKASK